MLKTIKTTHKFNYYELIKHIWENNIIDDHFFCQTQDAHVFVRENGEVFSKYEFGKHDTFTVEIEEPITKNTVFDNLIEVTKNDNALHYYRTNISDVATNHSSKRFYALISGKLELVWERDEE